MARIMFSNLVGQAGIYHTGSPNYVDVDNAYTPVAGMVTFAAKDTDDAWGDGDLMGVKIYVNDTNYKVWWASWDATNEYIEVITEEETVGTIADGAAVTVIAVPTRLMMEKAIWEPRVVTITGTTHTTLDADFGALHRCTNGSAVTVTLGADCRANWHGLFSQEGAGLVSFARASTDTINGGTANVPMAGQYKTAYVYQPTEGAWIASV